MDNKMSIRKIYLHSAYNCNANCIHCAVPTRDETIRVNSNKYHLRALKELDTASENSVECLIIRDGEPLLRPSIYDMIEYAKSSNIKVKAETNGFLLNEQKLQRLRGNVYQLCISLDGANPQTHNQIRRVDLYKNTTTYSIKRAREIGIDVAI